MWNSLLSMYWKIIKIYTKQTIALLIRFFEDTYELKFADKFKKKKKKRRMRIFGHRIFSKSFGGKIHRIWTGFAYRINKIKSQSNLFSRLALKSSFFGWRTHYTSKKSCFTPGSSFLIW